MIKLIIPIFIVVLTFLILRHFNKLSVKNVLIFLGIESLILAAILSFAPVSERLKTSDTTEDVQLSAISYELDSARVLATRFTATNSSTSADIASLELTLTINDCQNQNCTTIDTLTQTVNTHLAAGESEYYTVRFKRNDYKNVAEKTNKQFNASNQFELSISNYRYY